MNCLFYMVFLITICSPKRGTLTKKEVFQRQGMSFFNTHAHMRISRMIYISHSVVSEVHAMISLSAFFSIWFLTHSLCHASVRTFQSHFLFSLSVLLLAALSTFSYLLASQIIIIFLSFYLSPFH